MSRSKPLILIVDDVELNRVILQDLFYQQFKIIEASNGEEAVAMIERYREKISIVLLDIVMPVMDGFGVLQFMIDHGYIKHIPVFLITAENSDELINRGYDMGVTDVIQKPFSPSIIRRRVCNTIELYKHRFQMETIIAEQSEEIRSQADKIRENSLFMVDALMTAVEFRDCESGQHIQRIRGIAMTLLNRLMIRFPQYGLTQETAEDIAMASSMHDVGKIAIPDHILNKPGRLTDEEFEIMKKHTVRGCEILERMRGMRDDRMFRYYYNICRWHHEKWDGKGYPDGLQGNQIPICAQVVSVADCYDALVSERVYKKAYSHEDAVRMILGGECGQFNPDLVECLKDVADDLPSAVAAYETNHPTSEFSRGGESIGERESKALSDRTLRLVELERERYRKLMDVSNEMACTYYAEDDVLEFTDQFAEEFNLPARIEHAMEKLRADRKILYPEDRMKLMSDLVALTARNASLKSEIRVLTRRGSYEWYRITVNSFWSEDDPTRCVTMIGRLMNIDAIKREALKWQEQASKDDLTGLLNRFSLGTDIEQALRTHRRETLALFMLDVDNFKNCNDTFGHEVGDEVLVAVGQIICNCLRNEDIVGRLGGDEFIFVMKNVVSPAVIDAKAGEICAAVASYGVKHGYNISASIGIATYPSDAEDYKTLLRRADMALYHVKKEGKNATAFFSSRMENETFCSQVTSIDRENEEV